jgi:hypothetical protein
MSGWCRCRRRSSRRWPSYLNSGTAGRRDDRPGVRRVERTDAWQWPVVGGGSRSRSWRGAGRAGSRRTGPVTSYATPASPGCAKRAWRSKRCKHKPVTARSNRPASILHLGADWLADEYRRAPKRSTPKRRSGRPDERPHRTSLAVIVEIGRAGTQPRRGDHLGRDRLDGHRKWPRPWPATWTNSPCRPGRRRSPRRSDVAVQFAECVTVTDPSCVTAWPWSKRSPISRTTSDGSPAGPAGTAR